MYSFQNIVNQLGTFVAAFKLNFMLAFLLVAALWVIQIINAATDYQLNRLGIYPRHLLGLRGIVFSPFLHGNFNHLFLNSIPLLILIDFLLVTGTKNFIQVSLMIIVLSGFVVWLFGRKALHIGASGLIMGYMGYFLTNVYWHPSVFGFILALVCCYYFGSILLNLFHTGKNISWEGHVFGFLAGVAAAYLV